VLRVLVLGSAAGGGFPQWNCRCPVCSLAWAGDPRVKARTQSSVAVTTDGERFVLLNASPDLRQQILASRDLHPRRGDRDSPIRAVVVTNGDVDHVTGLLTLRERQPFALFGTGTTLDVVAGNSVFGVLDQGFVTRHELAMNAPVDIGCGITVRPFPVPGKVPLYLEGPSLAIGEETENTIGLEVSGGGSRFFYIPGCASVPGWLLDQVDGAPLLLFDGTTFRDDEMPRLVLSDKTSRRMGHTPVAGEGGTLERFASARIGRKVFIHINNTNPILVEGSPENEAVRAAGWEVSFDGMDIVL
jgi:pyrroloquinoline quinone biosynthesis protein B